MIVIISSCSASKDDTIPILNDSITVQPSHYLQNKALLSLLASTRERIFQDPRANVGKKTTYAFDLYARAGNAYRDLRGFNYQRSKNTLLSGEIGWFFLSGGYGIVHGLEPAHKYSVTFNRSIAYQKRIPFTTPLWKNTLPTIIEAIISDLEPQWTYVFGSRDYTDFVKQTDSWKRGKVKLFESTGSSGPYWLSPRIDELANAIFNGSLNQFNSKYGRFSKQ